MSSKEQTQSNKEPTTKKQLPQPTLQNIETLDQPLQRARLGPSTLSSRNVLQLQRTIGNRAVGQLLAKNTQSQPVSESENKTGLPDNLKAGIETLSGLSMDDVQVHLNSAKPTEVQALAYTQGTEIHVASGQEQHVPHEAWHVVQQKQGRVKPTMQMKDSHINTDSKLEIEADVMGKTALNMSALASRFPTVAESEHSRRLLGQPPTTLANIQSPAPVRQFLCGPREKTEAALLKAAREGFVQKDGWAPSFSCHNTVHYWLVKAGYASEDTFPAASPQDYQNAFYTGQGNPVRQNGNLTAPAGKIIVMYDMATGEIMHSMVSLSAGQWAGHNNLGTFGSAAPFTGTADVGSFGAGWWDGTGNILFNQQQDLGARQEARLRIVWMNPSEIGQAYQAT